MSRFFQKTKALLPTKRKIIQLYCAVLFNVNFKGFSSGSIYKGDTKKMCLPGLNCYSCPGAVGACPLGSLQGSFSADRSTLYYVCGILVLYGLLFGRMICAWMCPFGFIQELLHKIKTPKLKKNKVTKVLSYLKYVILAFFVLIVPIMYSFRDAPLPGFCKYICPAGTLEGGIGLLANKVNAGYFSMLGPLFTWKFLLLISIVVCCVFIFRMFCRFICPLGALYGFFNRISFFGVKIEESKCTHCNLCVSHCKMDIKCVGDHECISCGDCIDVCPHNAIQWKGPKLLNPCYDTPENSDKNKRLRTITRCICTCALLFVLIFAAVGIWNEEKPPTISIDTGQNNTGEYTVGNEIGNLCYGYDLSVVTKDGIISDTVNPSKSEKITIINFWGTWCSPCVKELPYFDRIASEYKDNVTVIAIHTNMANDTAAAYLAEHYPESNIIFATDIEDEGYYSLLGGRDAYPYTVILDKNGVIIDKVISALEYEDLKEYVENELNK